eukprot:3503877-Amphidinium_carterae.1
MSVFAAVFQPRLLAEIWTRRCLAKNLIASSPLGCCAGWGGTIELTLRLVGGVLPPEIARLSWAGGSGWSIAVNGSGLFW